MAKKVRVTAQQRQRLRAQVAADMHRVMTHGALSVQAEAIRLVTQHSGPTKGNPDASPSAPGEPPHLRTGTLSRSIDWEVLREPSAIVARIGTNLDYGKFLELGTIKMAPRPYLRPALDRLRPSIEREIAREWGGDAVAVEISRVLGGIYSHLTADSTFNTAIGGNASTAGRLRYATSDDSDTLPVVVYSIIDSRGMDASAKDGYSARSSRCTPTSPAGRMPPLTSSTSWARLSRTAISVSGHDQMKPRLDVTRGPVREDQLYRYDADYWFEGYET